MNHFSKIENYASYEKDQDLLIQFIEHDHELFYHSLTNSLRGENESLNEFKLLKNQRVLIFEHMLTTAINYII